MLTNLKTQKEIHFKHQEHHPPISQLDHQNLTKEERERGEIVRENEGEFLGFRFPLK